MLSATAAEACRREMLQKYRMLPVRALCNTSLFRLEFQCENRLKPTKPWHKTSAGLFDFRIQN